MKPEIVQNFALLVRNEFEKGNVSRNLLKRMYAEYNFTLSDSNLDSFLRNAEKSFPRGNCGLASLYLIHILGEGKVVRGKFKGNNHTFSTFNKGEFIADITADQFDGPRIYVGPLVKPWSLN